MEFEVIYVLFDSIEGVEELQTALAFPSGYESSGILACTDDDRDQHGRLKNPRIAKVTVRNGLANQSYLSGFVQHFNKNVLNGSKIMSIYKDNKEIWPGTKGRNKAA